MKQNMNRKWEIYTLTDPRTLRARYVGVTHKGEVIRYGQHLKAAKKGRTRACNWIRSLVRLGEKPIYLAIEYGQGAGWQDRERFWIATHRKFCDLVNGTDGGDGIPGYVHTTEVRARMSAAHIGNKSHLGHRASSETRAKMSMAATGNKSHLGHRASLETRAKMSAAKIGKGTRPCSPETRAKISAAKLHEVPQALKEALGQEVLTC